MKQKATKQLITQSMDLVREARARIRIPILWRAGVAGGALEGEAMREISPALSGEEALACYHLWVSTAPEPAPSSHVRDGGECLGRVTIFKDVVDELTRAGLLAAQEGEAGRVRRVLTRVALDGESKGPVAAMDAAAAACREKVSEWLNQPFPPTVEHAEDGITSVLDQATLDEVHRRTVHVWAVAEYEKLLEQSRR
jgi:hypothetical protein